MMLAARVGPSVIGLAAVLILTLAAAGCGRKSQQAAMALPDELKKIKCQKDSSRYADGHDFVQVAGTLVALRCIKQGTVKDWERAAKGDTHAPVLRITIKKTGPQEFVIEDGIEDELARPTADTQYVLYALARPHSFGSVAGPTHIKVATPQAFASSGPEVTFVCSDFSGQTRCMTRMQSKALHWALGMKFGPVARKGDTADDLSEALTLLAAHIVKQ